MQALIRNEITFERSHLVFVERRGIRSAPQIPDVIHGKAFLFFIIFIKISRTNQLVYLVQQVLPPILFTADIHVLETSILVERHRGMIKQIGIAHQIHTSIGKEATHVFFEFLAVHKRVMYLFYQFLLFISQTIRICRIYRREVGIAQRIFFAFIDKYSPFKVDFLKQLATTHSELRTTINNVCLQLKLNDGNSFMHLGYQPQGLLVISRISKVGLRCKDGTGIIRISIHRKSGKRQKIDAIPIFQCPQIAVTHRETDHVGHTSFITRCCTHPEDIVISPLDIEIVIITQSIHYDMGTRTTIVDITHDME